MEGGLCKSAAGCCWYCRLTWEGDRADMPLGGGQRYGVLGNEGNIQEDGRG